MATDVADMDGQLHDLYVQAEAARNQSKVLAGQLRETQRKARENWQQIRDAWGRAELLQADRQAARTDPDRLRYSAYARLQARLASMPVIEQAKGIIMAQYGWSEDQAFDALRRASQRENIKVRDLAVSIVARAARPVPSRRQTGRASATTARLGGERQASATIARPGDERRASTTTSRPGGEGSQPGGGSAGSRDRHRESA